MEGDYNFHYVTGLIDRLAVISERIPEIIVVGLSDKGRKSYVNYCTLKTRKNSKGKSNLFLKFIMAEVKPYVNAKYRTSDYDILIGHSIGGLFVINTLLQKPQSFENYIAISPALFWDDFKAEKDLEEFFKRNKNINKRLFLSIGNEKGMGILGFANEFDKNKYITNYYNKTALGLDYEFNMFTDENHNSVGLVSIKHL